MKVPFSPAEQRFFVETIDAAVREADAAGKSARGAWVKQRILRRLPDFREARWGFTVFREFVSSLEAFSVSHDGFDVVIGLRRTPARLPVMAARAPTAVSPTPMSSPVRVAPELWRAFIRHPTSPTAYLDRAALETGQLAVHYESPIPGQNQDVDFQNEPRRYLLVPISSESTQTAWVVEWAENALPKDQARELIQLAQSADGGFRKATARIYQLGLDRSWLRERSRRSIDILRHWLADQGIAWEPPITQERSAFTESLLTEPPSANGSDLRQLAQAIVGRMTDGELRQLVVPLGLAFDAIKKP